MSDEQPTSSVPQEFAKRPVFSKRIDALIAEIWETGGMQELRRRIDHLKQLPEAEFEAELLKMLERTKG